MAEASNESASKVAYLKRWVAERPLAVAIGAVTAGVVLFVTVRTLGFAWTPVFDDAGIWMRTWDVGTRATPLTGPPSRFGWHHPGPLLFYALAPLLRLFGGTPGALLAGVFLIGLTSLITIVRLAERTAGTAAALVLASLTSLLGLCYGDRLIDPWNPHVLVLPFALFLVAAWLACCGDAVAAPIAVVAGSFAAQSHLGAVPPVAIVGVSALALRVIFPPRVPRSPGSWRGSVATALLAVVLWVPPLIDQLSANGGNISRLLKFFREPASGPALGWMKGLLVASYELVPWGPWIGRERPTLLGELPVGEWWEVAASAAPLVIALVLALRFRDALGLRLVAIALSAFAACAVANAQTRGAPLGYLTLWSRSIAMLIVSAPLIVLVRKYGPKAARFLRSGVASSLGLAIVSLSIGARVLRAQVPNVVYSRVYERIVSRAIDTFPPGTKLRVAQVGAPFTASAEAIVVGLDRSGRKGRMLEHYGFEVGARRVVSNQENVPTLVLLVGPSVKQPPKPGIAKLVDQFDPLSAPERREAEMLLEKLERDYRAGGREDLVQPLRDGALWVWLNMPKTVVANELGRYFALAAGMEKLPWALYALPPGPW